MLTRALPFFLRSTRVRPTVDFAYPRLMSSAASSPARHFTLADSSSVYALAARPTPLGLKVADALRIIDQALADYGSVRLLRPRARTRAPIAGCPLRLGSR